MLILRLKILLIFFLFINLSSCQIDQSLTKIKESIVNIEFSHGKEVTEKEINDLESKESQGKIIKDIEKESEAKANKDLIEPQETEQMSKIKRKENKNVKETKSNLEDENKIENVLEEQSSSTEFVNNKIIEETEDYSKNKTEPEKKKSIFELLFGSSDETVEETIVPANDDFNETSDNKVVLKEDKNLYPVDKVYEEEIISDPQKLENKIDEEALKKIPKNLNPDNSFNNTEEKISSHSQNDLKEDDEIQTSFFQIKPPAVTKQKKSIVDRGNIIGLLVPLSGNRNLAGEIVLNTLRFNIQKNPTDLKFKIFDTKGTPAGAHEAAKKAIDEGINVFIGPIFSDETKILNEKFLRKKAVFFSLSTDSSNKSQNMIVTGQSPFDQVKCITKNLSEKKASKILLIHHNDRYGTIVKNSLINIVQNSNFLDLINIEFFEVNSDMNLNDEIKVLSKFERRKLKLEQEINKIKNNPNLSKLEKKNELKKFDRKLTIDVPFDSIIIASEGDNLLEIMSHLAFYDINSKNTILYGTSLWEDSYMDDKIYENTFFVSNLKSEYENFRSEYNEIFSKDPSSITLQLYDLIEMIKVFHTSGLELPENRVYIGKYGNSLLRDGFLHRETFVKKN